jgi:repressor LexA
MSLEQASEIQRKMYEFIVRYMKSKGIPPTNREIGCEMKIASTGHVDYHLSMLEKKGLITRQPKKSRGIELTKQSIGIPVMGAIAAGQALDIFPDAEESIEVGRDAVENEGTYALIVRGRSMIEDHICDGDYVVIKPQTTCQNGDIIVAVHMQEGISGSATLKRFFQEKEHDRVRLQPANSQLEPILIPKSVWDREWQVQGKVVAIFRPLDNGPKSSTPKTPNEINTTHMYTDDISRAMIEAVDRLSKLIEQKTETLNTLSKLIEQNTVASPEPTLSNNDSQYTDTQLTKELVSNDREITKEAQRVVDLAQEAAYERITTAAKNTRDQLNQIYEQSHRQAKYWFRLGLAAAVIGFSVIISGAIVAMLTVSLVGILTSIASVIPGSIAALFFQQAKEANKRLDDFYGKLVEVEEINRAVELCLTTNDEVQDHYKGLIIFRLLGLHTKGQEIPILDLLVKGKKLIS